MRCKLLVLIVLLGWSNWALGLDKPENSPSWWLSQARFVYQQGDLLGALQIVKEAQKRFPESLTLEFQSLEAQILYDLGKVEETVKILRDLSASYKLSNQNLLILAKAYLDLEAFSKALFCARLVEKRASQRDLYCEAKVLVAQSYLGTKLKKKAFAKAREILASNCSQRIKAKAIEVFIEGGSPPEEIQNLFQKFPTLKFYTPKFFKYLGDFYLSQNKLEEAVKAYFHYLNLSGKEGEAPTLLFKLAEVYFQQKQFKKARLYYELILTAWPHLDEAKFSKFRLYYLNYILNKKLGLPTTKERKILIPLFKELQQKYPQKKFTEEAQAFIVKLYLEDKRPEEAFFTAIDFLKRYPQSEKIREVRSLLCEANSLYLQKLYGKEKDYEILDLNREYQEFLRSAACGAHFYWVGKVFEKYYLEGQARYYFLQAYEFGVPKAWEPDLLLILAEKTLQQDKLQIARQLLKALAQKYPFYTQNPKYLYLEALYAYKTRNWLKARKFLEEILSQKKLASEIKHRTFKTLFLLALQSKDIDLAFSLLQEQKIPSSEEEFAFLVQMSLENEDYSQAKKILALAEKRFPDSVTLKWLKGLLFERLGQEKEALEVWKELSLQENKEGKLARGILKSLELVEEARKIIY